jgi:hypothetical protein
VSNLPNSECSDNKSLLLESSMRGNMIAGGENAESRKLIFIVSPDGMR